MTLYWAGTGDLIQSASQALGSWPLLTTALLRVILKSLPQAGTVRAARVLAEIATGPPAHLNASAPDAAADASLAAMISPKHVALLHLDRLIGPGLGLAHRPSLTWCRFLPSRGHQGSDDGHLYRCRRPAHQGRGTPPHQRIVSEPRFTIASTGPAQRALRKLPEKVATAAVEFIYGSLADNPHRVGKPLRNELGGLHSARRGDYRVIYRINADHQVIEIAAIEHRADAYRPY